MEEEITLQDYILVVYKRKWFLIGFVAIAVFATAIINFLIVPTYEASTTISLGKYNYSRYNTTSAAKEVILSDEIIMEVIRKLGINNELNNLGLLKKKIIVKNVKDGENSSVVIITVKASNPTMAKNIAETLTLSFLQRSLNHFNETKEKYLEELGTIEDQQKLVKESLIRNKDLLMRFWEQNYEDSLANEYQRNTIFEYIRNDEKQMLELQNSYFAIKREMLSLEKPQVINNPLMPESPVKPYKMLNILLASITSLMIGLLTVFVMEYFLRNPLDLDRSN